MDKNRIAENVSVAATAAPTIALNQIVQSRRISGGLSRCEHLGNDLPVCVDHLDRLPRVPLLVARPGVSEHALPIAHSRDCGREHGIG
jgi:hypothetical protein